MRKVLAEKLSDETIDLAACRDKFILPKTAEKQFQHRSRWHLLRRPGAITSIRGRSISESPVVVPCD
jgi:hypothetical protein